MASTWGTKPELSAGVETSCLHYFRVPPHAAKVLKGRPEHKQATTVPACNGTKTRFPDENDKKGDPQKMKAAVALSSYTSVSRNAI